MSTYRQVFVAVVVHSPEVERQTDRQTDRQGQRGKETETEREKYMQIHRLTKA